MFSRKEFFKHLLLRGIRAATDLSGGLEEHCVERNEPIPGFDLTETELSPALLAIEAEIRGIDLQDGRAKELRRAIYSKLEQNNL